MGNRSSPGGAKTKLGHSQREFSMNLQSKLIGAVVGALVLLASPAVQANPSIATVSAINASNAANSAVQSAVRDARDDTVRKVTQRQKIGIKTR
jgi:hypothetical protein